jgi:hypothetical protein
MADNLWLFSLSPRGPQRARALVAAKAATHNRRREKSAPMVVMDSRFRGSDGELTEDETPVQDGYWPVCPA